MSRKMDKYKIVTRVIALIMAALMVLGAVGTILFYVFGK